MTADGQGDAAERDAPRQRVVRVGRRRAQLTPAPGTDPQPIDERAEPELPAADAADAGPNDARMRADVPPHYGRLR